MTLAFFSMAFVARITRSSMLEVLHQDYVRTAVAKGVRPRTVVWRHALRNALAPVVTVVGLQLAIGVFLYEQRKERENEEEEVYQLLSDNYQDFLKVALDHPDLRLFSVDDTTSLNAEQEERQFIIFTMLVSLFERAYLLLYNPAMSERQSRRSAIRNPRSAR